MLLQSVSLFRGFVALSGMAAKQTQDKRGQMLLRPNVAIVIVRAMSAIILGSLLLPDGGAQTVLKLLHTADTID